MNLNKMAVISWAVCSVFSVDFIKKTRNLFTLWHGRAFSVSLSK